MNCCFNDATVLLVSFGGKDSDHEPSELGPKLMMLLGIAEGPDVLANCAMPLSSRTFAEATNWCLNITLQTVHH